LILQVCSIISICEVNICNVFSWHLKILLWIWLSINSDSKFQYVSHFWNDDAWQVLVKWWNVMIVAMNLALYFGFTLLWHPYMQDSFINYTLYLELLQIFRLCWGALILVVVIYVVWGINIPWFCWHCVLLCKSSKYVMICGHLRVSIIAWYT
jgi:hypothetical protein